MQNTEKNVVQLCHRSWFTSTYARRNVFQSRHWWQFDIVSFVLFSERSLIISMRACIENGLRSFFMPTSNNTNQNEHMKRPSARFHTTVLHMPFIWVMVLHILHAFRIGVIYLIGEQWKQNVSLRKRNESKILSIRILARNRPTNSSWSLFWSFGVHCAQIHFLSKRIEFRFAFRWMTNNYLLLFDHKNADVWCDSAKDPTLFDALKSHSVINYLFTGW